MGPTTFLLVQVLLVFAEPLSAALRIYFRNPCHVPYERIQNVPILTYTNGDLIRPNSSGIYLQYDETIQLTCPGNPHQENYFKIYPTRNYTTVKCFGSIGLTYTWFRVNADYSLRDISELGCENPATSISWGTGIECGNDYSSYVYKIGHAIPTKHKKKPLYNVCYNEKNHTAEFSSHIIHGSALNYRERTSDFKYAPWVKPVLETGYLSPFEDFVFDSSKHATHALLNTFYQWNTIKNGNWKAVEYAVRQKAKELGNDMLVVTGTYGLLNLTNKGIPHHYSKPIPNYVWKLVYDLKINEGIVLITSNNPFFEERFTLCKDVCKQYGWMFIEYHAIKNGKTYCCSIQDAKNKITSLRHLTKDSLVTNRTIFTDKPTLRGPRSRQYLTKFIYGW